jgi:hypothetical protein
MGATVAPVTDVREAILREVRENDWQPMDLLLQLNRAGHSDSEIKRALSELIQEGAIELTSHRLIRMHAEPAA